MFVCLAIQILFKAKNKKNEKEMHPTQIGDDHSDKGAGCKGKWVKD